MDCNITKQKIFAFFYCLVIQYDPLIDLQSFGGSNASLFFGTYCQKYGLIVGRETEREYVDLQARKEWKGTEKIENFRQHAPGQMELSIVVKFQSLILQIFFLQNNIFCSVRRYSRYTINIGQRSSLSRNSGLLPLIDVPLFLICQKL